MEVVVNVPMMIDSFCEDEEEVRVQVVSYISILDSGLRIGRMKVNGYTTPRQRHIRATVSL